MSLSWNWNAVFAFFTLLVFPLLAVLGTFKKRASPLLWTVVIAWILAGAFALGFEWYPGISRTDFLHGYLVGTALGLGFLAVDWLRSRREVAKWLKLAAGVLTLAVFAKALNDFLGLYG
jgi:hypothetical protein